ncbi:winged helix-turn-helix domain-containing protein [Psychroserpens sp. SPM9]|uniref:winged helix-turn-helix domain-containing protein n=1 Tax=Psychroserpens sp. SPM9 TaxID=2975598 RepID=UPI0021A65359|nr:winged helix-turn-helix domain-containing protein [Psychroserpens sp. SPM9]MDG5491571.1 winged helix-turn-helix domain-containing protein [Psychroserpens sp. SPM9]
MEKRPFYFITGICIVLILLSVISCSDDSTSNDSAKIKVALREAGNQLLLRQQDSTSIILPVLQTESSKYQLAFQNHLSFEPNELVAVIDSSFTVLSLSQNYRVEVIQCATLEVAYSYEIHKDEEQTLIPCSGRFLPEDCYTVRVTFLNTSQGFFSRNTLIYTGLAALLVVLLVYFKTKSKRTMTSESTSENYSEIGSFKFYPEQNKLVKAATEIGLSKKEVELLEIFVAHPNQVIKRDELSKKVWEDNGVIVGRSLDTYISKLRKKLKDDDRIKLTNVHGVGYKLELL